MAGSTRHIEPLLPPPAPSGHLSTTISIVTTVSATFRAAKRLSTSISVALTASFTIDVLALVDLTTAISAALTVSTTFGPRARLTTTISSSMSTSFALHEDVFLETAIAITSGAGGYLTWQEAAGPRITATFTDRWASGQHIGVARPVARGEIRFGRFNRRYDVWTGDDVGAVIAGDEHHGTPWQAFWTPTTPWEDLPNIYSADLTKNFDGNGVEAATIVIENIVYAAETGDWHSVHRGYLSPLRGYVAAGRDRLVDEQGNDVNENSWFAKLFRNAQVNVWEGYGDEEVKVFTGLIDDVDTTSRPDKITLTCRSFGKVLTDERIFGWNKDPDIDDPVVFISADDADQIRKVATAAVASSAADADHPSENAIDSDSSTSWRSEEHTSSTVTEYIEIHLPQGRYDDYVLWPEYDNMGIYVSLFPMTWTDDTGTAQDPTQDGTPLTPGEWVDGSGGSLVPGANGGITYIEHVNPISDAQIVRTLGASYVVGDDSILRISFRPLGASVTPGNWLAGVRELYARQRQQVAEAATQHWVVVDDISDVVRVILRWAGFKEWEVEDTGVKLPKRMIFNRGNTYMDAIKAMADAIGYVFYLKDPTLADYSIGIPVFRKSFIVAEGVDPIATVTDRDLLTGIDVKQSDEALAYIIRVRGRESTNGDTLGGDRAKRVMYTFSPPWRGTPPAYTDSRLAGIIKHVIHTNPLFRTVDDCKFAAFYIGLAEALESVKAQIEFPGYPAFDLDEHAVLQDLGTGLTTRLAIAERHSTFQYGENSNWTMTLSGALIDTQDVQEMVAIIRAAVRGDQ